MNFIPTIAIKNSYAVFVTQENEISFLNKYHSHPEFELIYIKEGVGKRIIGHSTGFFTEGDLVLIGPGLPHVWQHVEANAKAIVIAVYFNPKIFAECFFYMNEATALKELLTKSQHGIIITGNTKKEVITKIQQLEKLNGFEKMIRLLDILNIIAASNDIDYINKKITNTKPVSNRLTNVLNYIQANISKTISLAEVASVASLTPQSFCRYFKQKTGKTFVDYLQEKRIQIATQCLLNIDLTSAEIAYQTGFKTASGFNRLFKKVTGYCPTDYRKAALTNSCEIA